MQFMFFGRPGMCELDKAAELVSLATTARALKGRAALLETAQQEKRLPRKHVK